MPIDWIANARRLKLQVRNFVNGRWQDMRGDLLRKYAPRDGSLLVEFNSSAEQDVNTAIESARSAFDDGRWRKRPIQNRRDALSRLASLVMEHQEELALLESLDTGKPITAALTFDIVATSDVIKTAAEAADKYRDDVYGVDHASLGYQLRRPIGVVGAIVGWNFPLVLAAQKLAPALAMGNSLILKPSEVTSLSTARLAELAMEAGVPEGVCNVIHGGAFAGSVLATQREVDLITFTGSTETGKRLMVASGESNLKRLILECGGKAPNIVFDDCPDLECVADAVVARAFWNQGQVCTAGSRVLVQASIKDKLLPLIVARASSLAPGDPLKEDTTFGALVSKAHQEKVLGYIDAGLMEGAEIACQPKGAAPFENGFYVAPVVFDKVLPEHRIAQEEIFGPVLSVVTFRDEEEAIKIANDSMYGLSAIIWTTDLGRAHRVTHAIKAGWIVVNATGKSEGDAGGSSLSVEGQKGSGFGKEGGMEGLKQYTTSTAVQIFL